MHHLLDVTRLVKHIILFTILFKESLLPFLDHGTQFYRRHRAYLRIILIECFEWLKTKRMIVSLQQSAHDIQFPSFVRLIQKFEEVSWHRICAVCLHVIWNVLRDARNTQAFYYLCRYLRYFSVSLGDRIPFCMADTNVTSDIGRNAYFDVPSHTLAVAWFILVPRHHDCELKGETS